jgi:hypothetical protein
VSSARIAGGVEFGPSFDDPDGTPIVVVVVVVVVSFASYVIRSDPSLDARVSARRPRVAPPLAHPPSPGLARAAPARASLPNPIPRAVAPPRTTRARVVRPGVASIGDVARVVRRPARPAPRTASLGARAPASARIDVTPRVDIVHASRTRARRRRRSPRARDRDCHPSRRASSVAAVGRGRSIDRARSDRASRANPREIFSIGFIAAIVDDRWRSRRAKRAVARAGDRPCTVARGAWRRAENPKIRRRDERSRRARGRRRETTDRTTDRENEKRGMASLFARCTPGTYDALETAAKGMMHAQLACALLGTCGWQGTGYLAGVAAMSCFGLVAIETGKSGLLKVRERRGERRSGFELN